MSLLSFLNQDNFRTYNIQIARYCKSVNAAIMLSDLANRYEYHLSNGELTSFEAHGEGWFFLTSEKAEERTALTRREQDSAIDVLKKLDLISQVNKGVPQKRFFKINEENVLQVFLLKPVQRLEDSNNSYNLAENAKVDWRKAPVQFGGKRQTAHIVEETHEETHISLSSDAESLKVYFLDSIKKFKPDFLHKSKSWDKTFDLIIRVDKRLPEDVKNIIDWAHAQEFWQSNLLSPSSLRKSFDQLHLKMKNDASHLARIALKKQNAVQAQQTKEKYPKELKCVTITRDYVRFIGTAYEVSLEMEPSAFALAFKHVAEKVINANRN
jgi:hypothetical protein